MKREPDRLEKRIRFGCGFFAGLIIGFLSLARYRYSSGSVLAAASLIAAVICGWLAMKQGDEFWYDLLRRW